ncbi:MAG TPA: radical SAM protein, partial [Terriglobales bacterium]|nr:radical SAM protein [Terriglobales bacterium]
IEITKECPLHCPGCYAFDAAHLGSQTQLRDLSDFRGDALVTRVLALIDEHKPLHVSLVGGDPLVRYRELDSLLPQIESRGVHTQVVTSAFRVIPVAWMAYRKVNVVVSIDGLQPEHDARRKPATYDRILRNIKGTRINIHCTITSQIAGRPGYLDEFLGFWCSQPEVEKVWFSVFTPQRGMRDPEILTRSQRAEVIDDLKRLRARYPALDMPPAVIRELESPPRNPEECIFARTTKIISADLRTPVTPCQFGGDPDCERCGCIASMGLAAVGHHRVMGGVTAGKLFMASNRLGNAWNRFKQSFLRTERRRRVASASPFRILER